MTTTTNEEEKRLKNTFATDMNVSFMLGITLKLITPSNSNPLTQVLRHLSLKEAFEIHKDDVKKKKKFRYRRKGGERHKK